MMRAIAAGLLVLAACGNGATKSPQNRHAPQAPEPGVFMTPPSETSGDDQENQLYVSVWNEGAHPNLALLCTGPCLPNKKKEYASESQAYRSDRVRAVSPDVWEATMRLEATLDAKVPARDFTLRLELGGKPRVEFDGRKLDLVPVSFQTASYHLMSRHGEREAMLFVSASNPHEFMIKPAPPGDTFLHLDPNDPKVQTLRTRNWHYRLVHRANLEEPGLYPAVLHGELVLPKGMATIDLDTVRTPENDVAFWLTRENQPKVRFLQTNDSNTHRFESCTGGKCHVVFLAQAETRSKCPTPASWVVVWLDPDGGWRSFTGDGDKLYDRSCKVAYTYTYVMDSKIVVRDASGTAMELPMSPQHDAP